MRTCDLPHMAEPRFRETKRSLGRETLAVVLLLVLVGCGGSASQAPAAATPAPAQPQATAAGVPTGTPTNAATAGSGSVDACAFLTPKEVSAAFGSPLDVGVPSSDELYAYCTYQSAGGGKVDVYVSKSAEAASSAFATVTVNKGEAVSGVGDEAFWSTDSSMAGLFFLKGGVLAHISGSSDGPEDPIIQLGKLLASRM
jgi:hypothetical protein